MHVKLLRTISKSEKATGIWPHFLGLKAKLDRAIAKAWSGATGLRKSRTKTEVCSFSILDLPNWYTALPWSTPGEPSSSIKSSERYMTTFFDEESRTRFRRNFIIRHPFTESQTGSWLESSTGSASVKLLSTEPSLELALELSHVADEKLDADDVEPWRGRLRRRRACE